MTSMSVDVLGAPAPQGSHRGFVVNGRAVVTQDSKKTKPWRQDVTAAAQAAIHETPGFEPYTGPVAVVVIFSLPRPGYHYGTGRNAGILKPSAPSYVDKKPDVDKLLRSTLDALTTAGVFRDDAQVVELRGVKQYADAATGARITIRPLPDSVSASGSLPAPGADTDNPHDPQAAALSLPRDGAAPAPHPDAPHAVTGCGAGPSAPQTPGVRVEGEATGRRDTTTIRTAGDGALF